MTDAEAQDEIEAILVTHSQCSGCPTCLMLRHALQAIDDREALVMQFSDAAHPWPLALIAARLHMRGEG